LATGTMHQRHVRPGRFGGAEQSVEVGLSGGGSKQVIASHHFFDSLSGIIDHHGKVVRRDAVGPFEDEIVDRFLMGPREAVGDLQRLAIGRQAQRRGSTVGLSNGPLLLGELPARSWIVPGGVMRSLSGFAHLAPGTPAVVRHTLPPQFGQGVAIAVHSFRLPDRDAVPVQTELFKLEKLPMFGFFAGDRRVKVFETEHKLAPRRSGQKPSSQRRSEVPEV